MAQNDPSGPKQQMGLGIILGALVLIAAAIFIVTGGDLGGTKKVEGDADLPQVTSPQSPGAAPDNTGAR